MKRLETIYQEILDHNLTAPDDKQHYLSHFVYGLYYQPSNFIPYGAKQRDFIHWRTEVALTAIEDQAWKLADAGNWRGLTTLILQKRDYYSTHDVVLDYLSHLWDAAITVMLCGMGYEIPEALSLNTDPRALTVTEPLTTDAIVELQLRALKGDELAIETLQMSL